MPASKSSKSKDKKKDKKSSEKSKSKDKASDKKSKRSDSGKKSSKSKDKDADAKSVKSSKTDKSKASSKTKKPEEDKEEKKIEVKQDQEVKPEVSQNATTGFFGQYTIKQTLQKSGANCLLHNKPLKFYCEYSEALACYDCTVMGPFNT
jgi:hypothetical protein